MIGIVIPAHDEELLLPGCLDAAERAARHPGLGAEPVEIVVVLDACTDRSKAIVREHGLGFIEIDAKNVGVARHVGALALLERGARWLAFTDADSAVGEDWLVAQLALQHEVVCGTVEPNDWSLHPPPVGARFATEYQDRDGHQHIHGANLGLSARAYLAVGGFPALTAHEDVGLVERVREAGIAIAWSAAPRVVTSTRLDGRATAGFAAAIRAHHAELAELGRA